jgi:hypothetical protein
MPQAPKTNRNFKLAAIAAGGLVLLAGGAFVAGTLVAKGMVEDRLTRMTDAAGLQLTVGGIDISPLGEVRVSGLRMTRPDGSDVVAVAEAVGRIAPLDALAGRRRPHAIEVEGLKVDVRVQDGKPMELLDLYRAARSNSATKPKPKKDVRKSKGTSLSIRGGEFTLTVIGKGADALPKGLAVRGLRLEFDPERGIGEVDATVDGADKSKLSARLRPATKDRPAHIEAQMNPQLRVNLPTSSPLAKWLDAVVVRGFGYDGEAGPSIDGVELHRGTTKLLSVGRIATDDAHVLGLRFDDVAFSVPAELLEKLRHKGKPKAGAPSRPGTPRAPKPNKQRKKKRRKKKRPRTSKRAANKAKTRSATVTTKAKSAKAKPKVGASKKKAAGSNKNVAPPVSGTIASCSIGTDNPLSGEEIKASARGLKLPLPNGIGAVGLASISLVAKRPSAEVAGKLGAVNAWLQGISVLKVEQPFVDVVMRAESMAKLPGGTTLHGLVTRARRGPVAHRLDDAHKDDDHDGDESNARALPPEAAPVVKKKKKRRRKGPRKPFTSQYIPDVHKLHRRLLAVPDQLDAWVGKLNKVPQLSIKVTGGRLGLSDPVADKPFAGLKDIQLTLTAKLSDGTRGLDAKATPFSSDAVLGTVSADLTTGTDGKLDQLKAQLKGPSFARMIAAIGATASVKDDAELSLQATLKRREGGGLQVDGELSTQHIGVNWWRLAPRPIDDFSVSAKARFEVTQSPALIRFDASELKLGEAKSAVLFEFVDLQPGRATAHLKLTVPSQDCGTIASSIPTSMLPTIGPIEATGELGLSFDLTIPLHKPYGGKLDADLSDEECVIDKFGNVDVHELAKPFSRPVNESGTILEDQLIGPKSNAWVDLASLSPWVPYAMIATEDAAFYHHRGVRLGLLGRAIKMCFDHGRFVYGGSTITQQLIKNIYLTREKNLARKFEELLIVWHIERSLLDNKKNLKDEDRYVATKDRLLELYINGIEYGPSLYGITRASREYFDKEPTELSPLEATFLAANKPCPKCGHKRFTTRKWTPWWQERMVSIMSKMRRDGIITDDEFSAEAPYVPRFRGWPGSARKQPGSAIGGVEE